jgi:hypothetical protein
MSFTRRLRMFRVSECARNWSRRPITAAVLVLSLAAAGAATFAPSKCEGGSTLDEGRATFRFDTFGNEQFWTDQLRLNEVIESSLDPTTALKLGLKVDLAALPDGVVSALKAGQVDLTDPNVTLTLLELNAVVGVKGKVETVQGKKHLASVGITCALCHSTVDDSLARGIGLRRDGWPNRDLDPGAIVALAPALKNAPELRAVYNSWGPGFYDPRFNFDGISAPVVIPPAFGLAGVDKETYTAEGPVSYWNRYVAVTQMGGHGSFVDPRLGISITQTPDLVEPKLAALAAYQFSLPTPPAPAGGFDPEAARRGRQVFEKQAGCADCHSGPKYTDVNEGILHAAAETGMDPGYAKRGTTGKYRTTPLRALWQHAPYFHDGSAATLRDVVDHYDVALRLHLNDRKKDDLVEFLKSL